MDKRLSYILKVFEDSSEQEGHANDVKFYMGELGGVVVLVAKGSHARVMRRVAYRLKNNFQKNFHQQICYADNFGSGLDFCSPFSIQLGQYVDQNHTILQVKSPAVGPFSIQLYAPLELKHSEIAQFLNPTYFSDMEADSTSTHYQKLLDTFPEDAFETWEGYCACYERMYGHKPRAIGQLKEIRG